METSVPGELLYEMIWDARSKIWIKTLKSN